MIKVLVYNTKRHIEKWYVYDKHFDCSRAVIWVFKRYFDVQRTDKASCDTYKFYKGWRFFVYD